MGAASNAYPRAEIVHRVCHRDVEGTGPTHENGWYELTWLERGAASFRVGQRALTLAPGQCLLLPPDLENTPWVRGVSIHQTWIAPQLVEHACAEIGRAERQAQKPLRFGPDHCVSSLSRALFVRAAHGCDGLDPGQAATLDAIAYALAAPREERTQPATVHAALDLIASCYAEPVDIERMARSAGMGRFAFMRAFRGATGDSPYQYLLRYRLERAAEALRSRQPRSVLEVALSCGFEDPGRFARMFRRQFGCSPRSYRQQMRS